MWQNTVIAIPTGSSHPTPSVSTWLQLQAGGVSGEHRTCGPVLGESVGPSNGDSVAQQLRRTPLDLLIQQKSASPVFLHQGPPCFGSMALENSTKER